MKLVFWLTVSMCISLFCSAQTKKDSLKSLLEIVKKKGNNSDIASYLSNIGYEFLIQRNYDSSIYYYYQSLHYSTTNPQTTASSFNGMGVAFNYKGFQDSSILYYNKALDIYKLASDTTHVVIIETNLSIIYKDRDQFEKALEYAFSALSKLENLPSDRTLASCYNTIATIYQQTDDDDNALAYYRKSLRIRQQIGYDRGVGQSYNNIGVAYLNIQQYDSALANLLKAAEIKKAAPSEKNSLGTTLNYIGETYLELNMVHEARPYFVESRSIKKDAGERLEEIVALNNLAKVGLLLGDIRNAETYLSTAEGLITQVGSLENARNNLELKVALYKAKGDFRKALAFSEELLRVRDSLLSKEKAESLIAMQIRYETEKKEQQIGLLQQDQALQQAEINSKQLWILTLSIAIILLAIIVLLVFYNFKQSQRNKSKVETLLKELHHRVKNNLQILSSILGLQSKYMKDDDGMQLIKSSESRVNTMALIHKMLYSDTNNRTVNMKAYVTQLSEYLLSAYGFSHREITLIIDTEEVWLDVDKAIPVGLIANELISNTLKYAYPGFEHPRLEIEFSDIIPGQFSMIIRDNGKGFIPETADEAKTFGLKMIGTLVKELRGQLSTTTEQGTSYTLQIPTT